MNATDADASENKRVTYELLEGGDDKFVVDNTTGIIKIKSKLDRETKDQYKVWKTRIAKIQVRNAAYYI